MNTELIAQVRLYSGEGVQTDAARQAQRAIADALEAAQPKDPCGTCGEQVNYYRSGCPGCGAPVCCEACCRANQKSDALRGEIAYQLTKQLVIDMPTARAAVDSAFNASTGAAQPTDFALERRIDGNWALFCAGIGDSPSAPYPGMIAAFESHYGQSFKDKDWRNETSVWAAAWKAAKVHQPEAAQPAPQVPMTEPVKQAPPKGWMPDALRRAGFSEDEIKGVKP